jgi:hypothetical protein
MGNFMNATAYSRQPILSVEYQKYKNLTSTDEKAAANNNNADANNLNM